MDGRIGSLEVRYHTDGRDPLQAARLPALTRALEAQLADALDADLSATIGDGRDVYVVRELRVRTAVDAGWLLDRPEVVRVSQAAADAVSTALARPSDDVRHFADQADFLCAFIVDELDGVAVDRWYFGAFAPCRRADAARTIEAALLAHAGHIAATLGRLARRGRLDALLATLGARCVLASLETAPEASPGTDVGVLVDAALQLATHAGWDVEAGDRHTIRRALLARHADAAPPWHDRRVLSAFVWACVEDAAEMLRARGVAQASGHRGALVEVLHGDLAWLDAAWLLARCDAAMATVDVDATPALENRLTTALTRIATAVADGRVPCRGSEDDDAVVVRLLAAAHLQADERVALDALRAALDAAVRGWRAALATTRSGRPDGDAAVAPPTPTAPTRRDARASSSVDRSPDAAVAALTRSLVQQSAAAATKGEETRGAALYLLSRAVLDAGLPGLAATHGVPLSPLLAQLAMRWLALEAPLDGPAHDWTGAEGRAETSIGLLGPSAALTTLSEVLRDRLIAQGAVVDVEGEAAPAPANGADVVAILDAMAGWLLRAWARWLPGVHGASAGFLRAQCLARGGSVRRRATRIDVMLDPAPLDVVLQMAGYLRPIEALPWCGHRTVSFVIHRRPSA